MDTIQAMIELIKRQKEYIENHATGHLELNWCEGEVRIIMHDVDKLSTSKKKQALV